MKENNNSNCNNCNSEFFNNNNNNNNNNNCNNNDNDDDDDEEPNEIIKIYTCIRSKSNVFIRLKIRWTISYSKYLYCTCLLMVYSFFLPFLTMKKNAKEH